MVAVYFKRENKDKLLEGENRKCHFGASKKNSNDIKLV
jgi:hypothetical protein